MLQSTTGQGKLPPAVHNSHRPFFGAIGCKKIAGRHWILPVGRNFLQKTVLTANRGQTVWHGISGICKHGHASYHALNSGKHGPRSSSHQWCMIAQWIKLATWCKDACNKQNENQSLIKSESKASVTENQGTLHHLKYECPLTPTFGLTPQTK